MPLRFTGVNGRFISVLSSVRSATEVPDRNYTMKYFWVFAYAYHYPNGGMGDCKGRFASMEEAEDFIKNKLYIDEDGFPEYYDEVEIVDIRNHL